jgi:hypothetical protein
MKINEILCKFLNFFSKMFHILKWKFWDVTQTREAPSSSITALTRVVNVRS